jgi:hypothetical protein
MVQRTTAEEQIVIAGFGLGLLGSDGESEETMVHQ